MYHSARLCTTLQGCVPLCKVVYHSARLCTTLQCTTFQGCVSLCKVVHHSARLCTTLQCTTLQGFVSLCKVVYRSARLCTFWLLYNGIEVTHYLESSFYYSSKYSIWLVLKTRSMANTKTCAICPYNSI